MSLRDDLEGVRECVVQGWTRGHLALDKHGTPCIPNDEDAAEFCLVGAMQRMTGATMLDPGEVYGVIADHLYPVNVTEFNDSHTKAQVIRMLDKVIAGTP